MLLLFKSLASADVPGVQFVLVEPVRERRYCAGSDEEQEHLGCMMSACISVADDDGVVMYEETHTIHFSS